MYEVRGENSRVEHLSSIAEHSGAEGSSKAYKWNSKAKTGNNKIKWNSTVKWRSKAEKWNNSGGEWRRSE